MDVSTSLVQAYLHVNGYFTAADYPLVESVRNSAPRTLTDIDMLAARLARPTVTPADRAEPLKVQGNELFYAYMVDNQAIVIPETIDAIRALTRAEADGGASIARTNAALGIGTLRW